MAAVAAAALIAGCGGDEEPIEPIGDGAPAETEEGDGEISQRAFIAAADSRCSEANAAIANLSTGAAAESLTLVTSQERQITSGVRDALDDLGAPPDPDGSLQDYLDALDEQVQILRQMERAAANGDTGYDELSDELAQAKADARVAAEEYGFRSCGQEGDTLAGEDEPGAADPDAPTSSDPAPAPAPSAPPAPGEPVAPPSGGGTGGGTGGSGGSGGSGGGGSGGGGSGGIGAG